MTPQELKNSILQLAIQGKLVEQRPEEGTAAELLGKIARYGTTGTHGTTKTTGTHGTKSRAAHRASPVSSVSSVSSVPVVPSVPDDEKPFDIPESWEWVRLGDVCEIARGGSPRPIKDFITTADDGVNWIKIGDTEKDGKYISSTAEKIKPTGVSKSRLVHAGDFLLTNSMSFGRPYILKIDGCIHDGWLVISPPNDVFDKDYLYWSLSSGFAYTQFCGKVSGAVVKNLNSDKVADSVFPLPPLAEQKRIVAKIEELLPLIDRYEKAWSKLEDFNKRFPVDMQKSLLQMAIQGKLVEQRPEEGTGEELYCQIQAEKQRLIKSGKIKKEKLLPEITEDEIPFEIPESWKWVRLGILCELVTSGSRDWAKFYSDTGDMFLRMGNLSRNSFKLRLDKIQHVKIPRTTEGQRTSLQAGDLLFSITGEVGTLGLIPEGFGKAYINQHTAMIRFLMSERNRYVPYLMLTDYAQKYYNGNQHGIKNSFRLDSIAFMPIPLPPLAEQKRIVATLEELLPLCERLK